LRSPEDLNPKMTGSVRLVFHSQGDGGRLRGWTQIGGGVRTRQGGESFTEGNELRQEKLRDGGEAERRKLREVVQWAMKPIRKR
jgi:hypothetical protein